MKFIWTISRDFIKNAIPQHDNNLFQSTLFLVPERLCRCPSSSSYGSWTSQDTMRAANANDTMHFSGRQPSNLPNCNTEWLYLYEYVYLNCIRSRPPSHPVPVVFLVGFAAKDDQEQHRPNRLDCLCTTKNRTARDALFTHCKWPHWFDCAEQLQLIYYPCPTAAAATPHWLHAEVGVAAARNQRDMCNIFDKNANLITLAPGRAIFPNYLQLLTNYEIV